VRRANCTQQTLSIVGFIKGGRPLIS